MTRAAHFFSFLRSCDSWTNTCFTFLAILEVGGGCRKRLVDRPKSRAVCLPVRNDGLGTCPRQGSCSEGSRSRARETHSHSLRPKSIQNVCSTCAEGVFSGKLLGGPAAPPITYARRPRHKARGLPRSKKKDFWRNLFLAVYSTAQTPGSRARGTGAVGRLGEASKRAVDGLRDAAKRVK